MTKLRLKKRFRICIINLFIFLFFLLFIFSIWHFGKNTYYEKKANSLQEDMIEEVIQEKDNDEKEVDFEKLDLYNPDIVAWIDIPGTHIQYPILKGRDNAFYLDHDAYKKYNIYGSIFMNYRNQKDFSDQNTILFGHNSYGTAMFSDLLKIYRGELGNDITIFVYTENETYEYQVYASYVTDEYDDVPLDVQKNYFERSELAFPGAEKKTKTLTLSTCYHDDERRVIVHAMLKK